MGILHMKDAGDNWACQCLTCLYRMEVCTCTESKRKSDNESYFYSLTSHRLFFFSLSFFFSISLSFAGNLDRHTGRKAEQWHPFLSACVAFPCVQTMAWLPVCLGFLTFYLWCSDRLKLPGWLAAQSSLHQKATDILPGWSQAGHSWRFSLSQPPSDPLLSSVPLLRCLPLAPQRQRFLSHRQKNYYLESNNINTEDF